MLFPPLQYYFLSSISLLDNGCSTAGIIFHPSGYYNRPAITHENGELAALLVCHLSCQHSLHTALRKTSIGLTLGRAQCMPAPFKGASTTTLLALSTMPDPIGQPCAYAPRVSRGSSGLPAKPARPGERLARAGVRPGRGPAPGA